MRRAALLLALGLLACEQEEDRTYSYLQVKVTIDRASVSPELLDLVVYCHAEVTTPRGTTTGDLNCKRRSIPYDLGTFEYSTTLTQGTATVKVLLKDLNGKPLAEGDTGPVAIVGGQAVDASVTVKAIPGATPGPQTVPGMP